MLRSNPKTLVVSHCNVALSQEAVLAALVQLEGAGAPSKAVVDIKKARAARVGGGQHDAGVDAW